MIVAAPAGADWLVMTDGTQVETDGPWTERGKLVVFTDTSGTLVSLRLSEVDLDASRQATADAIAAANRPAPPPPPPPKSVFSITDADVGHIDPDDEEGEGEGEGSGETQEAEATSPTVVVIAWEGDDTGEDGLQIRGTLENQGQDVAVALRVSVTVYDNEGIALATTAAQLASTGLVSGESTELVANFPDVFDFAAVNFDVEHRSLATRSTEDVPSLDDSVAAEG